MPLLVSIGPSLGIRGNVTDVEVDDAAVFDFRTYGSVGPVTLTVASSTYPSSDWTFADAGNGTATLTTADANTIGEFSFTLQAVDDLRIPVRRSFSFAVFQPTAGEGAPTVDLLLLGTLPDMTYGEAYSETLTISGGSMPYSASVFAGALPDGIDVSTSGSDFVVSGTPTVPLALAGTLPGATENQTYSAALSVVGGTPPFTFSIDDLVENGDEYWDSVITLLQFNTANGTTPVDAVAGNTWTITSPAEITDNAGAVRAEFGSIYGNNSLVSNVGKLQSAVSSSYQLGTGDFTIEGWIRLTAQPSGTKVFFYGYAPSYVSDTQIYFQGATSLRYFGNGADRITATVSWTLDQWYHIAVSRVAGTTRMFVDGVQVGSSYTDSLNYTMTKLNWMSLDFFAGAFPFGYADDLRITKGVGRYTTTFTPPTTQFVAGTGVTPGDDLLPPGLTLNSYTGRIEGEPGVGSPAYFASPGETYPFTLRVTDSESPPQTATSSQSITVTDNPGDPYFGNVSYLCHCDGTDAATTFTDVVSGVNATVVGNAQVDTSQSKFGGASAQFDGTGDYFYTAQSSVFNLSGVDGTVECWARVSTFAADPDTGARRLLNLTGAFFSVSIRAVAIYVTQSSGDRFGISASNDISGAGLGSANSSSTFSTNTWYHIAMTKSGNVFRLYVDGVLEASFTASGALTNDSNWRLLVGTSPRTSGQGDFSGWLDDIRVTKGVARYTAAFTPPTAAFPDHGQ